MREIKFRAWDIEEKYMFPIDTISFPVGGISVYGPGVGGGWSKVNGDHHKETIILEQFTGLRDKNGKEIYEGDIISGASNLGIGIVTWNYNSWVLINHFLDADAMLDDGEVIGNIHENPELVKA